MTHLYDIVKGQWTQPYGWKLYGLYSGGGTNPQLVPLYRNKLEMVGEKSLGPIPPGVYRILPAVPVGPGHTGPFVLELVPDGATAKYIASIGRTPFHSFYIHGDNATHTASDGCIVAARAYREAINKIVLGSAENPEYNTLVVA